VSGIDSLYRQALLSVADAPPISAFVKKQGRKLGVSRFVAGEALPEVLEAARRLQQSGLGSILDLLGEFIATEAGAAAMTAEILATLEALKNEPGEGYMSVKPTQLGLGVDFALGLDNARRVAEKAREVGAQLCLDMENVPYVDDTLKLYRTLHEEGFTHVSTVLQSYLYRTKDDLEALLALEPKPTLRIVKGAYRESKEVAFQDKADVDAKYRELVYRGLEAGAKINIATHDESIIRETEAFVRGAGLGPERYEFQLLYGVKPALQKRLVKSGHKVRIYIPYGEDWYGYFSRRLAERPANLLFVVRGLFG
jgi:proline dehydrogenase